MEDTSTIPATFTSLPTPTPVILLELTTSTPSCQNEVFSYMRDTAPLVDQLDLNSAALSGAVDNDDMSELRLAVEELQLISDEYSKIDPPECAKYGHDLILAGLDRGIIALSLLIGGTHPANITDELESSLITMQSGYDHIFALAFGDPTPTPISSSRIRKQIPTPMSAATPMPSGSAIMIDNWQIIPQRVEIQHELWLSESLIKPAGRFALVFMSVTNRGLRPNTFSAFGTLDILDEKNNRYEEDVQAHFYAFWLYESELSLAVDVNPDETVLTFAVYDISESSAYYVMVPGLLAEESSGTVYLNVPK